VKLRETIGELEAFSYSLSHDLRAPLRAMRSFSELLRIRYADRLDEEANGFLDRIMTASARLDRLIQDVLVYTRVTMAPVQLEALDVDKLVHQILREHQAFQEPQASVIVELPLHPVLGHEAPLTQCIYNLLSNAVKFVEAGKKPIIRIRSQKADSHVTLWFEDNGIGIPKDAQRRMFLMFQRLHRPDQYEGTGIGLAIVRKAVERMGGSAGVDSDEGAGSRFWVRLPAVPVASEPTQ
jgi:signal transduction histidine kinase